jgi:hypothetical protein
MIATETGTRFGRDPNSTSTTCFPHYPETFRLPTCTYTTTYTAEVKPTKDEKAEEAKRLAEEKRVKKMKDMWKLDRKRCNGKMF